MDPDEIRVIVDELKAYEIEGRIIDWLCAPEETTGDCTRRSISGE